MDKQTLCDWCKHPAMRGIGGPPMPKHHICALHNAAPALLEALVETVAHLENVEAKPKNLAYTAFVAPLIARAHDAIKATKGTSDA